MRANASTAWCYFDACVFVAHRPQAPSAEDFEEFMRDVRAHRDVRGILVFANEAPPSPGQRALIQRWFKDTGARGSVMTDSLVARGAVTALHWLGVPVRAFSRADLAAALSYVGISEARVPEAQQCAQALLAHTAARRAAG